MTYGGCRARLRRPPLRSLNFLPQSRQQDCPYPPSPEIGSLRDRSRRTRRTPSTPPFPPPEGHLTGTTNSPEQGLGAIPDGTRILLSLRSDRRRQFGTHVTARISLNSRGSFAQVSPAFSLANSSP